MLYDCGFSWVASERLCFMTVFFLGCLRKALLRDCVFSWVASERLCFMIVVFIELPKKDFAS